MSVDAQTLAELERSGPELLRATRPFAREDRSLTWRLLLSTVALQALAMTATFFAPLPLKPLGSLVIAGLMIRLFIFVHDAEHGAIFRGSTAGRIAVWVIGFYTLNAPPCWRENHSRHHRTNTMPLALPLSNYRLGDLLNRTVTVEQWAQMSPAERLTYRAVRNPLTIVFAWVTAFIIGHSIAPFFRDPRRLWHGLAALICFAAVSAAVALTLGVDDLVWLLIAPNFIGSMLGMYLFVAQHAFPEGVVSGTSDKAQLVSAALHGSSFFDMPKWMHWFTGNIGYHHVHHLNHRIPFYRLPEAMAAIPELQNPGRTSFHPRAIAGVLRANVWDSASGAMVSMAEAERRRREPTGVEPASSVRAAQRGADRLG